MKYYTYLSVLILLMGSCTRVMQPPLGDNPGQLDIEGNIINLDSPQNILLRRSAAFSSTNTYLPVTGASVSVTDQVGKTYPFVETEAGTYVNKNIKGAPGWTYTLQVITDTGSYTATSTMPAIVRLDSLTDKNRPLNRPKDGRDQKVISVYYQDPPGIANQYRFIEWVNGVQVNSVFTYDDQLTDGRYVTFDLLEQDIDIYAGDTVSVEMQCIDQPMYIYWFALESQQANNFNGAVAPANPPTNISPQTLGYFCAHTTQTIQFTVQ